MPHTDPPRLVDSGSFLRRLLHRRHLPKFLFGAACLATVGVLLIVVARRREASSPNLSPGVSAERMAAEKLIPPPVPEEENFAATPFLAAILEKGGDTESPEWPDDFTRADKWARQFPVLRDSASGQKTGRLVTDLVSWQKAFEESQSLNPRGAEIVVAETPDPATNAQAALAVLTALQPYEPVLRELRAASQRPHSRFNVHYELDNPWATLLPQLAVVKRTCQLVRLKTSAELAAGQAEEALRDAVLMLRLTDAPAQEPVLISQLVRVACWQIALQSIWEGLMQRRWSGAQLQTLQSHFEHFDFLADLKRVMEAERVWGNLTIAIMRDRRPPNFLSSLLGPDEKSESWRKEADRALAKCPREWFDAEQRNFNRLFDERVLAGFDVESRRVFPSVAESNARVVEQSVRETKNLVKDHLVFARAALISPAKIHLKLAHAQASADFAALACALERHRIQTGQFPETLAELSPRYLARLPHDLVDGKPLRYQRTAAGGYLLYSVGWNEVDEGGKLAFGSSGRSTEIKDGDWAWSYPPTEPVTPARPAGFE